MSVKNPRPVTASTYLVMVPDIRGSGEWRYVSELRVDRIRSNKPSLRPGEIVVRLKLHFDEASLLDSIPVVEAKVQGFTAAQPEPELVEVVPALDA